MTALREFLRVGGVLPGPGDVAVSIYIYPDQHGELRIGPMLSVSVDAWRKFADQMKDR